MCSYAVISWSFSFVCFYRLIVSWFGASVPTASGAENAGKEHGLQGHTW